MEKRRTAQKAWLVLLLVAGVVLVWLYMWVLYDLPLPESINAYLYGSDEYTYVALADIPEELHWATIVVEDKDFYSRRRSFDFLDIVRSLSYVFHCSTHECLSLKGATIPQRLAANLMLISQQDLPSAPRWHLRHFVLSLWITYHYTPDEILEFHLNSARYADQIYGVNAAAHY